MDEVADLQQGVPEQLLSDIVPAVTVLKRQIEVIVIAQFLITSVLRRVTRTL